MADLRSRVAEHIGRHFHRVSDHAANGCSYDPTGARGDICDCGHRGRLAADALTPLFEVARAARWFRQRECRFAKYGVVCGEESEDDDPAFWCANCRLSAALTALDGLKAGS